MSVHSGDRPASGQGTCVPGRHQCVGSTAQSCDGTGAWVTDMPCLFVCSVATGLCSGVCVPGSHQCLDPGTQQTCDLTGAWGSNLACSPGTCLSNDCTVCAPNAAKCKDTVTRQTCDVTGSGWGSDMSCAPGACVGTACTACSPNAQRCKDALTQQTCNMAGSAWSDLANADKSMARFCDEFGIKFLQSEIRIKGEGFGVL